LVWGVERDISPATVETYISYLRTKVDASLDTKLVRTVRGVGYALRED
jgi:two-component system response regulator MprA